MGIQERQILCYYWKNEIFLDFLPLAFAPHIVFSASFSCQTDFTKHHVEGPASSQVFTGCNLSLSFPILNTCDTRASLTQNCPRVFICCDLSSASSSLSIRLLPWTTAALFTRIVISPTCKKSRLLVTTSISPHKSAVTTVSEYLLLPKYIIIFIALGIFAYRPCNPSRSLKTGSQALYNTIWMVTLLFSQFANIVFFSSNMNCC